MRGGEFIEHGGDGAEWQHGLFIFLVVLALVVGTVFIVRMLLARPHLLTRPTPPAPPSPALAELDLRYARGEVSREEYLQRRADLLGYGHGAGPSGAPPIPPGPPA
jgi:putative membrane protein